MSLPALPTGAGLFVAVNPSSGRTRGRPDPVPVLRRLLPDAVVHVLQDGQDLGALLRERPGLSGTPTALGISGGDGSVSAAAAVALADGLPLLVLPGGTDDHFARLAGLDSIESAVGHLQRGEGAPVDLAEARGEGADPVVALNTMNVGLYPDFVRARQRLEPRIGRIPAMLVGAVLVAVRSSPLRVSIDGRSARIWTLFVGVGAYSPATGAPLSRTSLEGGRLDVRVLRAGPVRRAAGVLALVRHGSRESQLGPRTHRLEQFRVPSFEVRGEDGVPGSAHDGEVLRGRRHGAYRVVVRVLPGAVRVYRPTG